MADDIVPRLRDPEMCMCDGENPCVVCVALTEIERLRAAGDALAKQVTRPCRCVEAHDGAINETCAPCAAFFDWQEARRG